MLSFLLTSLISCFLLLIAQLLGFSFGFNLQALLRLFGWLVFFLVIQVVKENWSLIYPRLKKTATEVKDKFLVKRTKPKKKFVTRFLGKWASKKMGLILTTVLVIFIIFWQASNRIILAKKTVLIIALVGIIVNIFIFELTSDLLLLFLIFLWFVLVNYYKVGGKTSIVGGLFLLTLGFFFRVFGDYLVAEKMAIWTFIFLSAGTLRLFLDNLTTSPGENC